MKKTFVILLFILGISIGLLAQDFYDINTVNEIRLVFSQTNWDQLLDNLVAAGQEDRLIGTAIINGVTYDSVGVRYKGNSSYSPNRLKNPLNIKLDYVINNQAVGPYASVKLANGFMDPTLVRETLGYEIARKYMPAPKSNYANVYINNILQGVYTSDQDLDDYFGDTHFQAGDNTRIKGEISAMTPWQIWGYVDNVESSYTSHYELDSGASMAPFINFLNIYNNNTPQAETVLNMDRHLWFLAFENLFVNLDSPINNGQNYYIFEDNNNRFNPVLWDINECFGGFTNMQTIGNLTFTQMQNLDPLVNSTHPNYPILNKIINVPMFKRMYIAHMRTMIAENITNNWYYNRALELQAICGPSVQADPNPFFSYSNFLTNVTGAITGTGPNPRPVIGITQLMNVRATNLLNHSSFQGIVPTISAAYYSPSVAMSYSDLSITTTATDAISAYLGWRQNHTGPFHRVQMFDDGAHNDGAAADGVFGVTIAIGSGDIEYYIYAENSVQGKFYPERAEYEFMTIPVLTNPGELLINEIQAKNASYADPNGEFDDWVEIYNPNNYAIDTGGMYMTDSHYSGGINLWTQIPANVPAITTIPAHGYLVVWFDENPDQGPLHINDKLSGTADAVYLIDTDGTTIIDSYGWVDAAGLNVDDVSIGRMPDGGAIWQLFGAGYTSPCTPGTSNNGVVNTAPVISNVAYNPNPAQPNTALTISAQVTDAENNLSSVQLLWGIDNYTLNTVNMTPAGSTYSSSVGMFEPGSVIQFRIRATDNLNIETLSPVYNITIGYQAPILFINEIMSSNVSTITDNYGQFEDWVEIYNPNAFAVNLAGFYLTDNHYGDGVTEFTQISSAQPDSTTIPAGGFKVIWFDEDINQGVLHINTKLGASGDAVYLIAPDMITIVDDVEWTAATGMGADLSWGRYADGTENWMLFGSGYIHPASPGTHNAPVSNNDEYILSIVPSVSVYPNPMNRILNIEIKNSDVPSKVNIYNLKGQLVREIIVYPGAKYVWDAKDKSGLTIASGLYFMKTKVSGKVITQKFIKLD